MESKNGSSRVGAKRPAGLDMDIEAVQQHLKNMKLVDPPNGIVAFELSRGVSTSSEASVKVGEFYVQVTGLNLFFSLVVTHRKNGRLHLDISTVSSNQESESHDSIKISTTADHDRIVKTFEVGPDKKIEIIYPSYKKENCLKIIGPILGFLIIDAAGSSEQICTRRMKRVG